MPERIAYEGKLCIATPFYNRQASAPYALSLATTARLLERLGVDFIIQSAEDSYIGRARNKLCKLFLDGDCTDLFFIDSDEGWDSVGFVRVLMAPVDVCGASYKMKNNWDMYTAELNVRDGHPIGKLITDKIALLEAISLPCGFMRINRRALEKYRKFYPELKYMSEGVEYAQYFECTVDQGEFVGEDVAFCRRYRAMGETIWCEPNATITHYGMNGWEGNLDQSLRAVVNG